MSVLDKTMDAGARLDLTCSWAEGREGKEEGDGEELRDGEKGQSLSMEAPLRRTGEWSSSSVVQCRQHPGKLKKLPCCLSS